MSSEFIKIGNSYASSKHIELMVEDEYGLPDAESCAPGSICYNETVDTFWIRKVSGGWQKIELNTGMVLN